MAWVERQRSGRYRGMYRDAAGQRRSAGTFTREAEAVRRAAVAEDKARADPTAVDPREGRVTWGSWATHEWWPRRGVEPGTENRDSSRFERHLMPRWGDVALTAIRREDVQSWVLELSRSGLAAWTVIHCYHLLSSSMRAATLDRKITASPCHDIKLPTVPEGDERFLTHAEVDRVAATMREPYRTLVLLLVGSGLRWGEAVGLHWHRVDLAEGFLDVVEVWDDKTGEIKPYPKGRRRRRVWLVDWLVDELDRHRYAYPPTGHCGATHRTGSRCRSGLVLPGRDGAPIGYSGFRTRHWGRAVGGPVWRLPDGREYATRAEARRTKGGDRAQRVWRDGLAGVGEVTIHDCRHTFASWLVQDGVPLYDVAEQLGHTHTAVSAKYGHLGGASKQRVRDALAWRSEPAEPEPEDAAVVDAEARFRSEQA